MYHPKRRSILFTSYLCPLLASYLVVVILEAPLESLAIIPSATNLTKEQLIKLDKEVESFYDLHLDTPAFSNLSDYDDFLLQALRAYRHTTAANHFDFKYTRDGVLEQARGGRVNDILCDLQLTQLIKLANLSMTAGKNSYGVKGNLSLDILNFLESSARAESGLLNGNSIWWGSPASCVRARIPVHSLKQLAFTDGASQLEVDQVPIEGRYCMAHLQARSWPKLDTYFNDRLSIKQGICLPISCHSSSFRDSASIRQKVDYLTRYQLVAPFGGDRYFVHDLYCFPDEDSPFRRFDLGTKVFITFVSLWCSLIAYASYRYHMRQQSVLRLRSSVDIKLIVSQQRESSPESSAISECDSASMKQDETNLQQVLRLSNSSQVSTMTSGVEDIELPNFERAKHNLSSTKSTRSRIKTRGSSGRSRDVSKGGSAIELDFVCALAVQTNIALLLMNRKDEEHQQRQNNQQQQPIDPKQSVEASSSLSCESLKTPELDRKNKRYSQHLCPVSRRTSASNEALMKEFQQEDSNKVQAESLINRKQVSAAVASNLFARKKDRRVNIDIFDGLKTIATVYIIYGHTLILNFGQINDMRFADERMFDLTLISSINALQVVNLFYIITGTLLTYLVFKRYGQKQLLRPSFWMLAIMARYMRLLPAYLLVFWFARHVAPYTGAGPFWMDYRTDAENARSYCASESWSVMLTMSAADIKIPFDCVPQTWYLSNDFRTLLILPVFIMILSYNTILGYAVIVATFCASIVKFIIILRKVDVDFTILFGWKPHVIALLSDRFYEIYTTLSIRICSYLFGVVIGHLLYLYETKQIKHWPTWFSYYAMKVALLVAGGSFMLVPLIRNRYFNQFLPSRDETDSDTSVYLFPIFKSAMEICFCIILLLMATGGGSKWINSLSSSKVAKILSNVSYAVFLVHVEVMYKFPANKFESSYWFLFLYFTFFTVLSYTVAVVVYVIFELPINNLMRPFMKFLSSSVLIK